MSLEMSVWRLSSSGSSSQFLFFSSLEEMSRQARSLRMRTRRDAKITWEIGSSRPHPKTALISRVAKKRASGVVQFRRFLLLSTLLVAPKRQYDGSKISLVNKPRLVRTTPGTVLLYERPLSLNNRRMRPPPKMSSSRLLLLLLFQ